MRGSGKVAGFRFGAVSAGIRKDGRIDLALAVCDRPAVTAALFTRNLVKASGITPSEAALSAALTKVCDQLARSMVADGEGANHVAEMGAPVGGEVEKRANEILKQQSYTIELSLGDGPGEFRYLTCDLGHGYVDVNAGYRS